MSSPKLKITLLLLIFHIGCASTPPPTQEAPQPQETTTQTTTQEAPQQPEPTPEPTRPDLQTELVEMFHKDQKLRQQLADENLWKDQEFIEILSTQDSAQAHRLKEIITELGQWPDIEIVGTDGAQAAWIIAQHADRLPDLQAEFLTHLRTAADANKISKRDFAYLVDRVRRAQDKPQVYGTQFLPPAEDGTMEIAPTEDPENLDKRRAEMGLGTIEAYKAQMAKIIASHPKPEPAAENPTTDN